MSKIGIVTVLYNSEKVLEEFFLSIDCQNYKNFILYIVDNSPSRQSKELIQKYTARFNLLDRLVYLPSSSNIGVAAGNNVGIL